MTIYEDSRYQSATPLLYTRSEVDTRNGRILKKDPEYYLDDDRKQWSISEFSDRDIRIMVAYEDETPDQIANRAWQRPDLAWIVGEFNDDIGFDMFTVFSGGERITLPTLEAVLLRILPNSEQF